MSNLLTIDYESYYDDDYGFSKLTTEEYVRDYRWQTMGVSIKRNDEPTLFFSGTEEDIARVLHSYDIPNNSVVMHNARFDAAVLHWRFGIKPKFIFDTLSMARALVGMNTSCSLANLAIYFNLTSRKGDAVHNMKGRRRESLSSYELASYGEYCKNDSELTYELLKKLYRYTPQNELILIDWTIRAFTEPKLCLDTQLIEHELREYLQRKGTALQRAGITDPAELRSDERFAAVLWGLGVAPPFKTNAKGEQKWAFAKSDLEFMELLDHDDEMVVALVEARLGTKSSIFESRIRRLHGISLRGPLPVPLDYAGAITTKRWSGSDKINLQNLPRNTKEKVSPLRQSICAPKGKILIAADESQIELRVNAWQAGQLDLLDLLTAGGDPYSDMACDIYNQIITKDMGKSTHKLERFVGKTTVLGCGYQCGPPKFLTMVKIAAKRDGFTLPDESLDFARTVVGTYRKKNADIVNFWASSQRAIEHIAYGTEYQLGPYIIKNHRVWLPNGTNLYYPNLRMEERTDDGAWGTEWVYDRVRGRGKIRTKLYGGKLVENITQAVARIVMADAMVELIKLGYEILFTVHDEIVCMVDDNPETVQRALRDIRIAMERRPEWAPTLPLACEIETGYNYADAK